MPRRRKVSPYLIKSSQNMQETRNSIDNFAFSFLQNIWRYSMFMHSVLKNLPDNNDILLVPISQYIVSLVGCTETFLRDTFVYLLQIDENYYTGICGIVGVNSNKASDDIGSGVTHAEFISQFFNFQNASDIETAFGPLFEDHQYLTNISQFRVPYIFRKRGVLSLFALDQVFDVHTIFNETLGYRHRIVHDANYRPNISRNFISTAEALFILLPQIFAVWVAQKYDLRYSVLNLANNTVALSKLNGLNQHEVPYIFQIEDLIADDWVISE